MAKNENEIAFIESKIQELDKQIKKYINNKKKAEKNKEWSIKQGSNGKAYEQKIDRYNELIQKNVEEIEVFRNIIDLLEKEV